MRNFDHANVLSSEEKEGLPLVNAKVSFTLIELHKISVKTRVFAIEIEHFHVQHAYATPSDLSYFKRRNTKRFLWE